jgi:glucokinase
MSVVGIDLGGTKIAAGIWSGGALRSRVQIPTPEEGGEAVVLAMAQAARQAAQEAGVSPRAAGLGTPGPLDFRRGVLKFAPNIAGMTNFPLRDRLAEALGYPVYLENDANAAALAEHLLGAGRGSESSLFVTISTGVGGGFVMGQRVWRGANGQAAEVGHMTLQPGGPVCGCGLEGCFEAVAAGRAMERDASYAYHAEVSTPELFARFRAGEPKARRIVVQAARYAGMGLASLVKAFDPSVVILGGGVALHGGEEYVRELREAYRVYLEGWVAPELRLAQLGTEAGLLGAALTAAVELGEL